MSDIRIYSDEDVHGLLAHALRLRGWEAQTTVEAGRMGAEDEDQVRYATQNGLSILSYNVSDFPRIHGEFIARDENHGGIIVGTQYDPSRNVRALPGVILYRRDARDHARS